MEYLLIQSFDNSLHSFHPAWGNERADKTQTFEIPKTKKPVFEIWTKTCLTLENLSHFKIVLHFEKKIDFRRISEKQIIIFDDSFNDLFSYRNSHIQK